MSGRPPAQPGSRQRVRVGLNRNTTGLVVLMAAVWYAGASQGNGAAYLFGFVLASVALVSVFHTASNLRGLSLDGGVAGHGFCGEPMRVPLLIRSGARRDHYALRLAAPGCVEPGRVGKVGAGASCHADLWITPARRGLVEALPVTLSSIFPLGFVLARFETVLAGPFYVYPAPEGSRPLPQPAAAHPKPGMGGRSEGDDFAGLRPYRLGDSQRQIDWKGVARGMPPMVRQWAGEAGGTLELQWNDTAGLGHEERLSQLTRWILVAEREGLRYGLTLPGGRFPPGCGDAHYHRCLRALAEFPFEEEMA